ncbi:PREDICTED: U-box domain-containing protein 6 isoform X1 [Nelumbo nucifera]|uniref:RING-type E3 ubiquitin transferase n=2 Tax=Nelumbo nucifera TaxID=4432 RepID=A0A1U7Z6L6_NELNU|nr:PREDICTED: U-box domain-containing protein 6 isoform X1 [Nelumbo nucifera]XP_010248945.1 PREDICTED: U-box domain-containing protein 6 isoform X1 [Nelumbo nucifera]
MDVAEVEESLFVASDAKLYGEMCKHLSSILCKVLEIFPELEATRPRSRSGIQALCSLHIVLEKAKILLQHCSECSKLYLAITGDSILLKFEKVRSALVDSLRRIEEIVPQAIGSQISEIVTELQGTVFSLNPSEKQVGDEVITLLQQERKFNRNCNDNNELETFHQAVIKLGITSSRAALTERRALKKLIERARAEEDKRKESIVAYLLHLMRKYSKFFKFSDDNDSQGSGPCSPTVQCSFEDGSGHGGNFHAFDQQFLKLSSFNFKPSGWKSGQIPVPPEELRCPISLQLMYDPVIISSGQTYERICIEKWFSDGHNTCPKTQQELSHLCLTPNYCVKGLIASWCEHNGVPVPDGPPESLDLNYWRLALSESESTNSRSVESVDSCKLKGVKVVPLDESGTVDEAEGNKVEDVSGQENSEPDVFQMYGNFLSVLREGEDLGRQWKVVEQIRHLLKDDEEARIYMGANGFVDALVRFLGLVIHEKNEKALEIGAMALFNLAVNNNRNKELMLSAGLIPLLEEMIPMPNSCGPATALYLNISCLDQAKPIIGSSQAVPFLIRLLQEDTEPQCKLDAIHTLYNLSSHPPNIPVLLSAGVLQGLQSTLTDTADRTWIEKSIAVLANLASSKSGKREIILTTGLISGLASILDSGEPIVQEQAVACLLILCNGSDKCTELVLREGVIPALVSLSVNGTARGKDKAQKLLMLFREQRQRDPPPIHTQAQPPVPNPPPPDPKGPRTPPPKPPEPKEFRTTRPSPRTPPPKPPEPKESRTPPKTPESKESRTHPKPPESKESRCGPNSGSQPPPAPPALAIAPVPVHASRPLGPLHKTASRRVGRVLSAIIWKSKNMSSIHQC